MSSDSNSSTGIKGETLRWAIVTLLIPFAGFIWNRIQEQESERSQKLEQIKIEAQQQAAQDRANSELVIKLLPALTDNANPVSRSIALAVLTDLSRQGVMGDGLVAAVRVAIQDSEQRIRSGKADAAERTAITSIAIDQDRTAQTTPSGSSRPPTESAPATAISARAFVPSRVTTSKAFANTLASSVSVPRLYIQIFDEKDRDKAQRLKDWAQTDKNWLAPGIENVVATAQENSRKPPLGSHDARVVYFNDSDKPRADTTAECITREFGLLVTVQKSTVTSPAGQIEAWFPSG
jgi:hypothetical protein